jgi:hypothetical protein
VSVLKTDVPVLKVDVAVLKTELMVMKTNVLVLKVSELTTEHPGCCEEQIRGHCQEHSPEDVGAPSVYTYLPVVVVHQGCNGKQLGHIRACGMHVAETVVCLLVGRLVRW